MVEWHHQLNGCGLGWTPGVGDGQGDLACCNSWGHKRVEHDLAAKQQPEPHDIALLVGPHSYYDVHQLLLM